MPTRHRVIPAWPAVAWLALVALSLVGCRGASPPAGMPADGAPAPSRLRALQCMPTALVSLRLPLEEGLALVHDVHSTTPSVVDCVLALFGDRPVKSPAAFDRGYGRVFAHHEEDGTLALSSLPRERVQLLRLGATRAADAWLLRVDSGGMLEPSHYDVLFTTTKADGALVDHLLVGALGMAYRRDYDIDAADAFSIREDSGTRSEPGPGYRARYRISADGRFLLASAEVSPP